VLTALEDAAQLEYRNGVLIATFNRENILMRRVAESTNLFREIGEKLFGQPIRIEVRTSGQAEKGIDEAELKRRQLDNQIANENRMNQETEIPETQMHGSDEDIPF